jgi:hypothetical protein
MSRRPGMPKAELDASPALELMDQIKAVVQHLAEIPEPDRQRLSHTSRMHLDLADQALNVVLHARP